MRWSGQQAALLDTIITTLFDVGLSLQAAVDLHAEAARQRITKALGDLDEVISHICTTAYTSGNHQGAPG